ncbi:CgeB family protein [Nocardioides bigeumensis]|uniref:Spore protein YkvP/CgeB glycosyl transferase-like domain-containing protein n=1 Tax=Nocardioides bigeumensis TaxID=433657 RepID=A0ABN2YGP5_9ACTN
MTQPVRRLLLVTPAFHGYGRSLAEALERSGYDVTWFPYDAHPGVRGKLDFAVRHRIPTALRLHAVAERYVEEVTRSAVQALTDADPDIVVTIKGEGLGRGYWQALDGSSRRQVLWLYDEIDRWCPDPALLASRPLVVSYSRSDTERLRAEGLDAHYVPNAFDQTIPWTPRSSNEVVFVGARYPDRTDLLTALVGRGVPVRAYGRQWSRHVLDRVRTGEAGRPDVPAARDVSRSEAYGITAGSVAALSPHTGQGGFTMRTFELPGTTSLQLIDRHDVEEFYEPGTEVAVYDGIDELVDLCHRAASDRAWARRVGERGRARTLAEHTFDHRVPLLEQLWA